MTKKSIFLEYITPIHQEKHKLKGNLYLEPHDYHINIMQPLIYIVSLVFLSLTCRDIWGLRRDGYICGLTDSWFNLTSRVITKLNTSITFMFSPGHIIASNPGFPPPLLAHVPIFVFSFHLNACDTGRTFVFLGSNCMFMLQLMFLCQVIFGFPLFQIISIHHHTQKQRKK